MKIRSAKHDRHKNLPPPMTPEQFDQAQKRKEAATDSTSVKKRRSPKVAQPSVETTPLQNSVPDRSREWKPWSPQEKSYLRKAFAEGEDKRVMSHHLKRSIARIDYMIDKLALKTK
jgi:hypothetical protein